MCCLCGWENTTRGRSVSCFVQQGKPRHRLCCTTPSGWIFPSTPGAHDRYFFLHFFISFNSMGPKTINKQRDLFLCSTTKAYRSDISFNNIVTSRLWTSVFTKIKTSDVQNYVFSFISDIHSRVCDSLKLMKGKALRKHSLHEKTTASVLLKPFISSNE